MITRASEIIPCVDSIGTPILSNAATWSEPYPSRTVSALYSELQPNIQPHGLCAPHLLAGSVTSLTAELYSETYETKIER